MAPVSDDDRMRVKALLTEAVTVLCRDALHPDAQMNIEGLLGITVDNKDIILVNINEAVHYEPAPKPEKQRKSPKGGKRAAASDTPPSAKKQKMPKAKRQKTDQEKDLKPLILQAVPGTDEMAVVQQDVKPQMSPARSRQGGNKKTPKSAKQRKKKRQSADMEETRLNQDTISDIQRTIIEQEGCVVLSRILQRRKNKFCASDLIHCMRDMSRSQSDRSYIGEYKEIGNVKIFYKCPPELIQTDALLQYSISLQEYSDLFYHDFKPNSGCPTDWLSYVATVIANTPYNPMLFPIDCMGLDPEEKKLLVNKQLESQREFQEAASMTDSEAEDVAHSIKIEPEDHELRDNLSAVPDTSVSNLSQNFEPTVSVASSSVGVLSFHHISDHEIVTQADILQAGDCPEMIETETVIEDSLIMDLPDDFDSPT